MSFQNAFASLLAGNVSLANLVSTRIYRGLVPGKSETKPYITWSILSDDEPGHMTGTSELAQALVQVNCVGTNGDNAVAVSNAVREAIHTYLATTGEIRSVRINNAYGQLPSAPGGEPIGDHVEVTDYNVWHTANQPGQ